MALIFPQRRVPKTFTTREVTPSDIGASKSLPTPLPSYQKWSTRVVPALIQSVPNQTEFLAKITVLDLSKLLADSDSKLLTVGRVSIRISSNVGDGVQVSDLSLQLSDTLNIDPTTGQFYVYDAWGTNVQGTPVNLNPHNVLAYDWVIEPLRSDDFSDDNGGLGLKTSVLQAVASLFNGTPAGGAVFTVQASVKYNVSQIG